MRAGRLLIAAALMLAACSTVRTGEPLPGGNSGGTAGGPSSTARLLPPRPRDLDLTNVNPCTDVLTRDQLHQLAYDLGYQRKPLRGRLTLDNGDSCAYSSESPPDQPTRSIGSLIIVSLSAGADVWLTDPARTASVEAGRRATVAGFPALVVPNLNFVDHCEFIVDVHDDQYLAVSSGPSDETPGTRPEPACAEAERVAGMVMQNLLAGR